MSTIQYLTSDDEVDSTSIITDDFEVAKATQARYIDIFLNGKWINAYKLISHEPLTYMMLRKE